MKTHSMVAQGLEGKRSGGPAEPQPGAPHSRQKTQAPSPAPSSSPSLPAPAPSTQTGTVEAALCRPQVSPGPRVLAVSPSLASKSLLSRLRNRSFFGSGPVGSRFVFPGQPSHLCENSALGSQTRTPVGLAGPGLQVRTEVIPTRQRAALEPVSPQTYETLPPTQYLLAPSDCTGQSPSPHPGAAPLPRGLQPPP